VTQPAQWHDKETGIMTFILLKGFLGSVPVIDTLTIPIMLDLARPHLDRQLSRIEKELAGLGVELGGAE
jgi:hypothetical protein